MSNGVPHPPGNDSDSVFIESTNTQTETVQVRRHVVGHNIELNPKNLPVHPGDKVLFTAEHGLDMGTLLTSPTAKPQQEPLNPIVRLASTQDHRKAAENQLTEEAALKYARERIRAYKLSMKLVSVHLNHNASHATYYFSSADRVDFRTLVKDLAKRFRTKVEMRQIGVRDAARHVGGVGICGRSLCCSSWLPEFKPISIRMAKDQNLPLNQDKLSGLCGRLRCCLKYEHDMYKTHQQSMLKVGERVQTPLGEGRIKDIDILQGRLRIHLKGGTYQEFNIKEVTSVVSSSSRKKTHSQKDQKA